MYVEPMHLHEMTPLQRNIVRLIQRSDPVKGTNRTRYQLSDIVYRGLIDSPNPQISAEIAGLTHIFTINHTERTLTLTPDGLVIIENLNELV